MDFAVFPYLKSFLRGQRFNLQELRQEVLNIISRMKPEQLVRILICRVKRWPRRSKKVDFIQCLGNVINFRSDDPGISQYHFAFDKIIPIYALILIIIRILIKKTMNLTKIMVIYILFTFISFYQSLRTTLVNIMNNFFLNLFIQSYCACTNAIFDVSISLKWDTENESQSR